MRKKEEERRALRAAGRASSLVPIDDIQDFEQPDFKVRAGNSRVGIEVSEILPVSDSFNSPLAEKSFHERMIQMAERKYNSLLGAIPVGIGVFFWTTGSGKYDMETMARQLAEFVLSHREEAGDCATFSCRADLPEGFGEITICATYDRPWSGGESVTQRLEQFYPRFAKRISDKNSLLPNYRANFPNVPIYLLIYSRAEVSRSVEIVHGMENWEFGFDFDRVFFFSALHNRVLEFRKSQLPQGG